MSHEEPDPHLQTADAAAWVDGTLAADRRAIVAAHLAACAVCRTEIVEVARIVREEPSVERTRRRGWAPAIAGIAAAAAALLIVAWPRPSDSPEDARHRDETLNATAAPRPIAPIGVVAAPTHLRWSSVPYADRYQVRVFDLAGNVVWDHDTPDTLAALPKSIALRPDVSYFWKVEALTGFDRHAASELTEFVISGTKLR